VHYFSLCLSLWDIARLLTHHGGQQLNSVLTKMVLARFVIRCVQRTCRDHFVFLLPHERKRCFFLCLLSEDCNSFNLRPR